MFYGGVKLLESAHVRDVLSGMAESFDCALVVESAGPLAVAGSRDELVQVVQNLVETRSECGKANDRFVGPRPALDGRRA